MVVTQAVASAIREGAAQNLGKLPDFFAGITPFGGIDTGVINLDVPV